MMEAAIEAGADDCISDEAGHDIICNPDAFAEVRDALEAALGEPERATLTWRPQNTIALDEDKAVTLFKMIDSLEDSDDVQRVSANFEISDEILEKLSV
jgi:transcriptional/translational regulatory protein YebC/TACO1